MERVHRCSASRCSRCGTYGNSGDFAPTYYLQSDAPLYYYSFTDAFIAMSYRSLSKRSRRGFDPMITGFNPADMYAADHIRRVLLTFPGVFSGIGEFTDPQGVRVVQDRGRSRQSHRNPALDRILDFAGEAGLLVILHSDIDMPFPKPDQEPYLVMQMKELIERHPETTIIWAHAGLGRVVRPGGRPDRHLRARALEIRRSRTSTSTFRGMKRPSTSSRLRRDSSARRI